MLRAAYFAQELLSTFSTSLGEVALQPSTGGTFVVHLYHANPSSSGDEPVTMQKHLLWDRKEEGGFPETKELKRRVRDIIEPSRDLGHVDGHKKRDSNPEAPTQIPALPAAINKLQAEGTEERKFTPMDVDVDVDAGVASQGNLEKVFGEEEEAAGGNGKIRIGGDGGEGFCRPGDEDCG